MQRLLGKLTRGQKVYLALRSIGRPAHFSEVTEVHNSLFPDRPASENSVHAALCLEELGIVWIGVRGTFALKEWGYRHPSKGLYESVAEIARRKFKETGKPVPFTVIVAEMGKYRRIVRQASLIFAVHLNPNLQQVSKNRFVPKAAGKNNDEFSKHELDKVLREFEESSAKERSRTQTRFPWSKEPEAAQLVPSR